MLYNQVPYAVLAYSLTVRAYRTDVFTGWVDPTQYPGWDIYWWKFPGQLKPITAETPTPVAAMGIEVYVAALAVIVVLVVVGTVFVARRRRAASKEDAE